MEKSDDRVNTCQPVSIRVLQPALVSLSMGYLNLAEFKQKKRITGCLFVSFDMLKRLFY